MSAIVTPLVVAASAERISASPSAARTDLRAGAAASMGRSSDVTGRSPAVRGATRESSAWAARTTVARS
jgi:hypothetical protein